MDSLAQRLSAPGLIRDRVSSSRDGASLSWPCRLASKKKSAVVSGRLSGLSETTPASNTPADSRTTKLYDHTADDPTLEDVELVQF